MKIITNAKFYTMDKAAPATEALLIDDRRIVAAGSKEEIQSVAPPFTSTEDLEGKIVLPGLTDAHIHIRHYAQSLQKIDCETTSLSECLQRVADRVKTTEPSTWVLGHGWQQNDWPDCDGGVDGFPSAQMLDAITTDHPVYLTAKSLHSGWANQAALRAAGINNQTPEPSDGAIQRDVHGEPTGILLEGAMSLVSRVIPKATEKRLVKAIETAQSKLWSLGLTGVHDFDRRSCFVALQQLHTAGKLKLRVIKNIPVEDLDHAAGIGLRSGFGDDFLRIGNVKAFADGALGPHTAAMIQPYEDAPDNVGMLLLDGEEISEFGRKAAKNGFGMTVHAIGDRANHEVLNAYENIRSFEAAKGISPYRHRLEHVQLLHPSDLNRLAEMNVIASMQPIHATSDMFSADKFWGSRAQYSYAWRTLLNAGTRMAFGSDAPVESPNPFWGLHAAVSRTRPGDIPSPEGWYPEQRLSRMEALEGYTTGAAYTAGTEDSLGILAPGYLADLIVLENDFFTCETNQIRDLLPVKTMVGGEWVFEA